MDRPSFRSAARCCYEDGQSGVCRKVGEFVVPFASGQFCYKHAVALHVERSHETRIRRYASDRYNQHYGVSVLA